MMMIHIADRAGAFAENKDVARDIRIKDIVTVLNNGGKVVLDFSGVNGATQSFVHALLSDVLRKFGVAALDSIEFRSCAINVRKIIEIVIEYMQEGLGSELGSEYEGDRNEDK